MINIKTVKIKKISLQETLIYLFVFLGPLGTILTPKIFPSSTRTYYFLLFFFPLFYLKINRKIINIIVACLPIFLYCLVSAIFCQFNSKMLDEFSFPLFRFILLSSHFFFILGAVNNNYIFSLSFCKKLINIYLFSFSIGLLWGWSLYIGYHLKMISFDFLSHFNILTQYAWEFLRFNPGSYANEYGIVSSFVNIILILKILYIKTLGKRFAFLLIFILSFSAMCLASTKASLISLILSLLYLLFKNPKILKTFFPISIFIFLLALIFNWINIPLFNFIFWGFKAIFFLSPTHISRLEAIQEGFQKFSIYPFWGTGFGSLPFLHNAYLQFLYELGIIGFSILFLVSFIFFTKKALNKKILFQKLPDLEDPKSFPIGQIITIGFIHIITFALTNHNLFHHLSWLMFLLYSIHSKIKQSEPYKRYEKTATDDISP